MALRAAHLGGSSKGEQPSVFDIISQESLMKALKPAAGHLVKYLSIAKPHRFGTANKYYDELYLLFDLALQNQYLKRYDNNRTKNRRVIVVERCKFLCGSFAENFYAMKRVVQSTGAPPTDVAWRLRSLAVLVLWPYVHDKLEKLHERLKEKLQMAQRSGQDLKIRLVKLFVIAWPWIKTLLSIASTLMQLGYMVNRLSVHSPFLAFSGVRLEKLSPEDVAAFESIPIHLQQSGVLNRLWRFFLGLPGVFSRLFGYGLFFVQFVDFMYNSDFGAQLKKANSDWKVPPPPHKLLSESSVQLLETHKCPLCLRRRQNDTALSVSGYVFCYGCIDEHVRRHNSCPVTGLPATTQQLIRLYIQ